MGCVQGGATLGRVPQTEELAGGVDAEEEYEALGESVIEGGPGWLTLLGQQRIPLGWCRLHELLGGVGFGDTKPNSKKPFVFFFPARGGGRPP